MRITVTSAVTITVRIFPFMVLCLEMFLNMQNQAVAVQCRIMPGVFQTVTAIYENHQDFPGFYSPYFLRKVQIADMIPALSLKNGICTASMPASIISGNCAVL